jgi:hypothetical protein
MMPPVPGRYYPRLDRWFLHYRRQGSPIIEEEKRDSSSFSSNQSVVQNGIAINDMAFIKD